MELPTWELVAGREAKGITISPISIISKEGKKCEGKAGKVRQLDTLAAALTDR